MVSYGAGLLGAIVAGLNVTRLGRKRALVNFSALQIIAIAAYCLPALGFTSLPMLYLVATVAQFINGMAMTALFTVMMDKSERTTAGTDYTVQSSVVYISGILGATFSGAIAEAIGRVANTPTEAIDFDAAVAKWGRGIATFFSINNQVSAQKAMQQLGWQPQAEMTLLEDIASTVVKDTPDALSTD